MKPKSPLRFFLLVAGSSLLAVSSSSAVDFFWDANGGTGGTGGTGTWNATSALWRSGSDTGTLSVWPNTASNTDTARLAGTAGTITLNTSSVNINVNKITFGTTGYIINGPGSGTATLNLAGTTPTIDTGSLTATINARISGSAGLTKAGSGTLTLTGDNTYSGTTFVNDGILTLGHVNALGSTGSGNGTTITGSNAVAFQGTVLDLGTTGLTLSESFNLNGNSTGRATIRNNSSANQTLNGNIDVTSATNSAAITSNSSSDAGSITVNSDISGTLTGSAIFFLRGVSTNVNNRVLGNLNITGDLIKADAGIWTIGAASKTYSWTNTSVAGGTLRMGLAGVMPTATVLTIGQSGASTATFNLNGFNQTVAGIVEASGATTGTRTITSATAATLTVGSASNFSYGGVITGSLALSKTGIGNQTLAATNSYSGGTTITDGTLTLGHATDTISGAVNVNGGTLALGTNSDTVGTVTLTSGSITGTTGVLTGSSYDVRSGSVSAILGGAAVGLTKSTGGTVTLTGVNTYSGATQINSGTLAVNGTGSINSTSGVTIGSGTTFRYNSSVAYSGGTITNNGGTIGGSGKIGVAVTLDSTGDVLAPGNSPGIQEYTVAQTWNSFTYQWDINNFSGTTAGADFDQIQINNGVSGTLSLTGSTGSYVLDLISLAGLTAGDVANFSETTKSWNILTTSGGISGFNKDYWTINTAGFTTNLSSPEFGGTWSLGQSGNNLVLTYTAVPEPGAAFIGSLGMLVLLRRRRS